MLNTNDKDIKITEAVRFTYDAQSTVVCIALDDKGDATAILASGTSGHFDSGDYRAFRFTTEGLWSLNTKPLAPRAETPDQTPIEISVKPQKQSLREEMREYIQNALSQQAENAGNGTFEEEDDFDIDDDFTPISPYEIHEMIDDFITPQSESPPNTPVVPPTQTSDQSDTTTATPETNPPDDSSASPTP